MPSPSFATGRSLDWFASLRGDSAVRARVREVAEIFGWIPSSRSSRGAVARREKTARHRECVCADTRSDPADEPTSGVSSGDKHANHAGRGRTPRAAPA